MTQLESSSTTNNSKEIKLKQIVVLPGDNIGPEVTAEALRVLKIISGLRANKHSLTLQFTHALVGGAAIDQTGSALPQETLDIIRQPHTAAIMFGAIGGPQWKDSPIRPEEGLLALRKELDTFANIRPCMFPSDSLVSASPLRSEIAQNVCFVVVRELCGGIYFGTRSEAPVNDLHAALDVTVSASDLAIYSVGEIERVTRVACFLARQLAVSNGWEYPVVTSVDKANVLASSRLWRNVVTRVVSQEFPDIKLAHQYVDAAAMLLIRNPRCFNGVILTENLFGDILSDESSVIVGSLGLLPSASLNGWPAVDGNQKPGLYEPIHGSAPDIAGKSIANPVGAILSAAMLVRYSLGMELEAKAIEDSVRRVLDDVELGGFGLRTADLGGNVGTKQFGDKVCEVLREILGEISAKEFEETFDTSEKSSVFESHIDVDIPSTKNSLNLCEKILLHHAVGLSEPNIEPGDMICVNVDWTLASELTWKGMEKTYDEMGRPDIWRNDRFWLAVDHTVDPSNYTQKKPKELIVASEQFAKESNLKNFYGPNQTILHTEFYRKRALPGQLIIGADSHSCSAGGLGTFAVGLGAADVVMPLVTGQTWFKVPETVNIKFVGRPPSGIGGKDVILWVLGELKRNTVAFERAVEFTGPGCKYLSCDARFAIANMATEFGGIAGVFEADEITAAYIDKREEEEYRSGAVYFKADADAEYAETHVIDLSRVDSMVALYPSPDNVVPVNDVVGMELDGVFIGACTTAEEDLILAALVLEKGLEKGLTPTITGKRKVTPGSVSIVSKLRKLGLIEVYEKAGFEIGAPGCSYCLGIAADKAAEGEVWLSSQNRNFKNRMGKGSIGNLASAATVAASSFDMKIANPRFFLDQIDKSKFKLMLEVWGAIPAEEELLNIPLEFQIKVTEPFAVTGDTHQDLPLPPSPVSDLITGRVQKFGENVDTDAIIPAEFMPGTNDADLGTHCFQFTRPDFRNRVLQGYNIVVAGKGFGSGSSREEAPRALKGCGVQVVLAESFAFIYARNQANMALLGVTPQPFRDFYDFVQEGSEVKVNVPDRQVCVLNGGHVRVYSFELSQMEERLLSGGGVTNLYSTYGKDLFRVAMQKENLDSSYVKISSEVHSTASVSENVKKLGGLVGGIFPMLSRVKKLPSKVRTSEVCEDDCEKETKW